MAIITKNISEIDSLSKLLDPPRLLRNQTGVLALDFDQCLVQAKPTLGDEHFYSFLQKLNLDANIYKNAHYSWTCQVREIIEYETCEKVEKVNAIIDKFREAGWNVVILTSRGLDMYDVTEKHLKESGLGIDIEDVIFKDFRSEESRAERNTEDMFDKDESLLRWMENKGLDPTKVKVMFVDDDQKYIDQVLRLIDKVRQVRCFHFTKASKNADLSQESKELLLVQLLAYSEKRKLPYSYNFSDLQRAMEKFYVKEVTDDMLYSIMKEIAEQNKTPFQTKRKR